MEQQNINVLALVKGNERYVFMYNGQNREQALETFGRYASDPQLSFNWRDAAVMTQKVMRERKSTEKKAKAAYERALRETQPCELNVGVARGMRRLLNDILGE